MNLSEPASRLSAARARRHVEHLRASGLTIRAIARRVGVGERTVHRITAGDAQRMSRITERLVLALS